MAPLRLLVNGAKGRMGQAIIACAKLDPEVRVTGEVDAGDDFAGALSGADAVIEFSHHTVTVPVAPDGPLPEPPEPAPPAFRDLSHLQ